MQYQSQSVAKLYFILIDRMKMDWQSASDYARRLFEESRWSKCIYAYVQAAFICMQQNDGSLSDAERLRLASLMK